MISAAIDIFGKNPSLHVFMAVSKFAVSALVWYQAFPYGTNPVSGVAGNPGHPSLLEVAKKHIKTKSHIYIGRLGKT